MSRHLGILMLDTAFPRLPGDVGHATSWRMPVRWRTVTGASPQRVVRDADASLLAPFAAAAQALAAEGAAALTTSCGFLVRFQAALQAAVPVPVWTSALLALPALHRPGVLTVDARSLGADELEAAGADPATPVQGLADGCALQRTLLENLPVLDAAQAEADTVAAARRLCERHPAIDALVLECTNLPPYADALRRASGLPVHDLPSLVEARWSALGLRR